MIMMMTFLSHPGHSIHRIAVCRIGFCRVKRKSDRGLYLRSSGHGRGFAASAAFLRRRSVSADCVDFMDDFDAFEPPWSPDVMTLPMSAAVGACTTGSGFDGWVEADDTRVGPVCVLVSSSWSAMAYGCVRVPPPAASSLVPSSVFRQDPPCYCARVNGSIQLLASSTSLDPEPSGLGTAHARWLPLRGRRGRRHSTRLCGRLQRLAARLVRRPGGCFLHVDSGCHNVNRSSVSK